MDERALRDEVERLPRLIAEAKEEVARLRRPETAEAHLAALRARLARAQEWRAQLNEHCNAVMGLRALPKARAEELLPKWRARAAVLQHGPSADRAPALQAAASVGVREAGPLAGCATVLALLAGPALFLLARLP